VAFHVQLSSPMHHARLFNLSQEELRAKVLEPWLAGRSFELAEGEWDPRESSLKILEGRHLDNPDLAFGQGWSNAERSAEDVTERELQSAPPPKAPDAFVVEAETPEATVGEMLGGLDATPIPWTGATERIDGRDPEIAAVILVVKRNA
jgi:hypothetical protein